MLLCRIVRDQANKTLDIYLQRVRKYSQTLPDTTFAPQPTTGTTNSTTPRMGTPQQDTSWAGWAISSFTNKLTSASGQIQPNSNGQDTNQQLRPSSVPPTISTKAPSSTPLISSRPALVKQSTSTANPFAADSSELSNQAGAVDDFGADWGDIEDTDKHILTDDPFSPTMPAQSSPTTFDDKGEPDFAGWLTAQSQAKQKSKNPLPKGLAKAGKTGPNRPTIGTRSNTTGHAAGKKTGTVVPKAKPTVDAKKVETKPEDEDEGWGDAW